MRLHLYISIFWIIVAEIVLEQEIGLHYKGM